MLMDKGGKTFVLVGAMSRAHAVIVARQMHPTWYATGEIEAV